VPNVFISHRRKEDDLAEALANEIKDAGHNVWLDVWRIDLGDSIVEKMNEGLSGAAYVVLCYSSIGVDSPWMSREWMSALARQLNGEGIKILPVMLTAGEVPALIRDIKKA
jgi:hypothetical protein